MEVNINGDPTGSVRLKSDTHIGALNRHTLDYAVSLTAQSKLSVTPAQVLGMS